MRLRLAPLLRLAAYDLLHERWIALCSACVLAASLAPLLVLWGLEQGIVGTLIERMERDPTMRQVLPEGSSGRRFDSIWFETARSWPGVAFAMPNTRAIANQVDAFSDSADTSLKLDLLPTASGDPLLADLPPPAIDSVVLTAPAARRLKIGVFSQLTLALERERNGRREQVAVPLRVAAVLPEDRSERLEALAPLALLESVQAWRDGWTIADWSDAGNGPPPEVRDHPLFRIYAHSIRDVEALTQRLEAQGVSVYTRSREIASTLGLQRNLRMILGLTATVIVGGAMAAIIALQVAAMRRKRRDHAMLKLTGHDRSWLVGVAGVSALAVAAGGLALSFAAYAAMAAAIGRRFADQFAATESTMRLDVTSIATAFAGTVIVAVVPALLGGWHAACVDAADELREA